MTIRLGLRRFARHQVRRVVGLVVLWLAIVAQTADGQHQIRYQGSVINGQIQLEQSNENTIYFRPAGGRNFVSYRIGEVEIVSAPGISNADTLWRTGDERLGAARERVAANHFAEAVRLYDEAEQALNRILRPAVAFYPLARQALDEIRSERSRAWQLARQVDRFDEARQAQEKALQALHGFDIETAQQHFADALTHYRGIAVRPFSDLAAMEIRRIAIIERLLQQVRFFFRPPPPPGTPLIDALDPAELPDAIAEVRARLTELQALDDQLARGVSSVIALSDLVALRLRSKEAIWERLRRNDGLLETAGDRLAAALALREDGRPDDSQVLLATVRQSLIPLAPRVLSLPQQVHRAATLLSALAAWDTGTDLEMTQENVAHLHALRDQLAYLSGRVDGTLRPSVNDYWTRTHTALARQEQHLIRLQRDAGWFENPLDHQYHPTEPIPFLNVVSGYLDREEPIAAGEWLARAVSLFPDAFTEGRLRDEIAALKVDQANLLDRQGRRRDAIDVYREVILKYHGTPSDHHARHELRRLRLLQILPYLALLAIGVAGSILAAWRFTRPAAKRKRALRKIARADKLVVAQPLAADALYGPAIRALSQPEVASLLTPEDRPAMGRACLGRAFAALIQGANAKSVEWRNEAAASMTVPASELPAMLVRHYLHLQDVSDTAITAYIAYLSFPHDAVDSALAQQAAHMALNGLRIDDQTPPEQLGQRMRMNRMVTTLPHHVPSLMMTDGPLAGHEQMLGPQPTAIGRASSNRIVLSDESVALSHARIQLDADQMVVEPGPGDPVIMLNGKRLSGATRLKDGDHLHFGRVPAIYYAKSRPARDILPDAHIHLGIAYQLQGNSAAAVAEFDLARIHDPRNVSAHLHLAAAREALEDFDGAIDACRAAMESVPDASEPRQRLGALLLEKVRHPSHAAALPNRPELVAEAVENLKAAARLAPQQATVFFNLAEALAMAEDIPGASEAIQTACRLAPDQLEYQSFQASLRQRSATTPAIPISVQAVHRFLTPDEQANKTAAAEHHGAILMVDPMEYQSPALAPWLSENGFTVTIATGIEDALSRIPATDANLIIADWYLPDGTGATLCQRLKDNPATAAIPVIILSAKRGDQIAAEAIQAGADDFLTKPADPQLLLVKINRMLQAAERSVASAASDGAGVRGSLREMGFTDLIQVICAGAKDLVVSLKSGDIEAQVYVQGGRMVHATAGDKQGEVAVYEVMRWQDGEFAVSACTDFPEPTITLPTMSLLMEGARLKDENIAPDDNDSPVGVA